MILLSAITFSSAATLNSVAELVTKLMTHEPASKGVILSATGVLLPAGSVIIVDGPRTGKLAVLSMQTCGLDEAARM
jgi:hypothetical protein